MMHTVLLLHTTLDSRSKRVLPKAADYRGQCRGVKVGAYAQTSAHTYTHPKSVWCSDNGRYAFRGQVTEQEGNGAGGTGTWAPLSRPALHANLAARPPHPPSFFLTVSFAEKYCMSCSCWREESTRNRRKPVPDDRLFERTSLQQLSRSHRTWKLRRNDIRYFSSLKF